jgi:hypothetical protein
MGACGDDGGALRASCCVRGAALLEAEEALPPSSDVLEPVGSDLGLMALASLVRPLVSRDARTRRS